MVPHGTYTPYYLSQLNRLVPGQVRRIYWDNHAAPNKLQSIVSSRAFQTWGEGSLTTWRDTDKQCIYMLRLY